jgi:hypothetical protein
LVPQVVGDVIAQVVFAMLVPEATLLQTPSWPGIAQEAQPFALVQALLQQTPSAQ